jgi:exopolysaccharide production protein ExoQ
MGTPALIFCLLFIAFLLVRDSKRRATVSAATWIPTALLLILGSRPVSYWLGANFSVVNMANEASTSPLDQLFYFSVLGSAVVVMTLRHVKFGQLLARNMPLMLWYSYFAISIVWSEDPLGSTKRFVKDFGMLAVIAVILSEKNPLEAIRAIYVRCACILFPLSAVFIKWFPNMARSFTVEGEPMYTGVTMQKNTLGEIVLVFSLFLIWDCLESLPAKLRLSRYPWDRMLLLVMGFWLLHMCQSKTSFLCLIVSSALILRVGWFTSKPVSRAALAAAISLPYCLFFAAKFNNVIAPLVEALGRNMTFTGRTDIWNHITLNTVNPLIGAGYYNFWGGSAAFKVNQEMGMIIPNAHNGYIDVYLDGGIIGLVLLFFLLVAYGLRLMRNLRHDRFQRLRFAVMIAMIIYNLSESMYGRLSPIWFTTLLVMADFPYYKNRLRTKPAPLRAQQDHAPVADDMVAADRSQSDRLGSIEASRFSASPSLASRSLALQSFGSQWFAAQ